ncbi:MAG: ABC transporter ATP-binding protein [Bacteroidetes bacterium]|jgi:branched-chain amino acid transport system ATP-binding protein|nr:ABC transporter ATP-binding protein [Bacteroidota bacterium]
MALFEINNLTKRFGGLIAVDNLSFSIKKGEIFSIIGPNGAGKSTVFNCINGLYKPEEGSIQFKGENLIGQRPDQVAKMGIARTFQNLELFAHMTTIDNLLLGRHLHMKANLGQILGLNFRRSKAAKEEITHRRKVEEIIDFLELESARDQYVSNLPYGKQKLVELGRALALEPELILLDEPAAGLNQEEREEMVFWIQDIRDQLGVTVLLIEHNMQLVKGISDRILAISFGKKLTEGTPAEVLNHEEVIKAYLGEVV